MAQSDLTDEEILAWRPKHNVNRLQHRRQMNNELAHLLQQAYRRMISDGMTPDDCYGEILKLLEDRIDNLSRMGVPPAWTRG